jgi:hypothetical protein
MKTNKGFMSPKFGPILRILVVGVTGCKFFKTVHLPAFCERLYELHGIIYGGQIHVC